MSGSIHGEAVDRGRLWRRQTAARAGGSAAAGPAGPAAPAEPAGSPPAATPGRMRDVETVFVLGGGANRGALQVGMLRALVERGIMPDLLVGTSIGAVNAVAFASAPNIEGVYLAADIWRRLAVPDVFPRSRFHGNWRYLERRDAIYPNDGLRRVVSAFVRFEQLEEAAIPVVVVATRLEGSIEDWISEGSTVEAVLASAAMPGLYPVVERNGLHYIDGGVLNNVPISVALAARPKRVFVLLCSSLEPVVHEVERPYEALISAFALNLHGRLRRDLMAIPPTVDVVVLGASGLPIVEIGDFSMTTELIEQGYRTARQTLDEYEAAVQSRREMVYRWRRAVRGERFERNFDEIRRRVRGRGMPPAH